MQVINQADPTVGAVKTDKSEIAQATNKALGISLYTLLAAVVVLGILGSVLVTQFNGAGSKGQAAYALLQNIGQAANRFNLDTGCYPATTQALFDSSTTLGDANCPYAIPEGSWGGPYIEQAQLGEGGAISKPSITPAAEFAISVDDSVDPTQYTVVASGLTSAIADKAMSACGGLDTDAAADGTSNSSCTRTSGSGDGDTVTYVYANGGV